MERFYAPNIEEDYAPPIRAEIPHIGNSTIAYIFRDGSMKKGGEEIFGKVTTVPNKYQVAMQHLAGSSEEVPDFVVEVSREMWENCNEKQRKARLHDLLMRCKEEMKDDGTVKYKKITPDLNMFTSTLTKYGPAAGLEARKVLNRAEEQESGPTEAEEPQSPEDVFG
jgi:hypothetical protein